MTSGQVGRGGPCERSMRMKGTVRYERSGSERERLVITMAQIFDASSTTDEVLSGVSLHGKRILVTGVSAGIGLETARALAAHGAQVLGAARDLTKAAAAHGPSSANGVRRW